MDLVTKRIMTYWFTFFVLLGIAIILLSGFLPIEMHSSLMHSIVQSIATVIAFFVGSAALYRYYKVDIKSSMLLFIGVGFLATGVVDAYHTILTSSWFGSTYPSVPSVIIRWSWVETRIFLSVLLIISLMSLVTGKEEQQVKEGIIYTIIGVLTIIALVFFLIFPLPFPMYPERFISRPEELIPGFLFLIALIGYLVKGGWKTNNLDHWVVLCLIASVACQFFYMPQSKSLFDVMYMAAHFVKILSYAMIYMGITAI